MTTLYDIKKMLGYDCDLADDEYDTYFYSDIQNTQVAKEIEVVFITSTHLECRFSQWLRTHKDYVRNFIKDTYNEPYASAYLYTLDHEKENDENWAHLIEDVVALILDYEPLEKENSND